MWHLETRVNIKKYMIKFHVILVEMIEEQVELLMVILLLYV
jgi:hypothetical protein